MNTLEDYRNGQRLELPGGARRIAKASEILHPDFHLLLTYAEGALGRETRKRISEHVLLCEICAGELEQIEMEVLPMMARPINLAERLRWQVARMTGRIHDASGNAVNAAGIEHPAGVTQRDNRSTLTTRLAYGLAVVAVMLLSLLGEIGRNSTNEHLASNPTAVDSQKTPNASSDPAPSPGKQYNPDPGNASKPHLLAGRRKVAGQIKNYTSKALLVVARPISAWHNAEAELRSGAQLVGRGVQVANSMTPLLLGPGVIAVRPNASEFIWKSVKEAQTYELAVWSNNARIWQHSYSEQQTRVTLATINLPPGQICFWRVDARVSEKRYRSLRGRFYVLDEKTLRTVEVAERYYKLPPSKLGGVFGVNGLYEDVLTLNERDTTRPQSVLSLRQVSTANSGE